MSTVNLGKQFAALVSLGTIMSKMGIQPGGVLFGSVIGFGAGNISRDYGFNIVDTMTEINKTASTIDKLDLPKIDNIKVTINK